MHSQAACSGMESFKLCLHCDICDSNCVRCVTSACYYNTEREREEMNCEMPPHLSEEEYHEQDR